MTADAEQIDVLHLGHEHVICCHRRGEVLVDPGPEVSVGRVVDALGGQAPRAILLTHIHLDHAGGTGALVRRWPEVEVWVHELGAPHLVDPSKLIASATRLYGEEMDRLWGEIVPVPQERVRVLRGGELLGDWRVAYTPGHAQHHVAYLHEPSGTAYTGDVAGVRVGVGPVLAPTPPPDIDLDAWHASIALLRSWSPERLAVTHYGSYEDVAAHLDELDATLTTLGELARMTDGPGFGEALRGIVRRRGGEELLDSYFQAMPPEMQLPGLQRYWSRRAAGG